MSRGTPDALRRDAVADPRHADAVGAPLDPVGDSGGSAGRWAVLAAALVLVIAAGVAVVVRARRLHQR